MESRRGTRYPVHLDCKLSLLREPDAAFAGQTLDMSSCGVLVTWDGAGRPPAVPGVGELARVVVELPQAPFFRGCWLDCACRVVRVEEHADVHRVALDVRRYQFRPATEDAPVPR
jgi:hypothetical protein